MYETIYCDNCGTNLYSRYLIYVANREKHIKPRYTKVVAMGGIDTPLVGLGKELFLNSCCSMCIISRVDNTAAIYGLEAL